MGNVAPHEAFKEALGVLEQQVGETTQFWFAATTINEAAKNDPRLDEIFNLAPLFWRTVRGGLEYQAIVSAGKIFGPQKSNPLNIDWIMRLAYDSRVTVFSREAFAARRATGDQETDRWLPELLRRVHQPTSVDFRRLRDLVKKHRKTYTEQFEPIRSSYIAHSDGLTATERAAMFGRTKIRDFERMLGFLNQLYDVLWQLYYNGRRPVLRPVRSSVRRLAKMRIEDLRLSSLQEDIIAQTRTALALLTRPGPL